jgi:hypothetical protein
VALTITTLYVFRPSIFPNQVWAMRRFLPVTIPALLLLGAWAAQALGDRLAGRRPLARPLVPALAIAAALAVPAWQLADGLFDTREQSGALSAMDRLCDRLPEHAVVWTIAGPDETRLLQPVHAFCRVPVAQSPPKVRRRLVRRLSRRLAREGRPLYLLSAQAPPPARLLRPGTPAHPPVVLRYEKLEESLTHRPRDEVPERLALYLARP